MNWQERMEAAIGYLERNLEGKPEWGRAAAEANCSAFHFLRMFEVVTGTTAGEYIRRRRLSLAAQRLSTGDHRVIDIALAFGYESADAFAKAFKREFGVNPSEAKEKGVVLRVWPRLSFSVVLKGDIPMEYRIETRDALKMTGLALAVSPEGGENFISIPAFWQRTIAEGNCGKLEAAMPPDTRLGVMGVCANDYSEKTKTFTYLIAIEQPADKAARAKLPAGCIDIEAPAGTWAVFGARGPLPVSIQAVWKRIYGEWFPASGYEHAGTPELEVYSEGDPQAPDYYSEVWVPIRKVG